MALKAGRVGVAKDQVDEFGKITGGSTPENVYTKTQCDNKFETKAHIGGLQFRDNDGTAQYKLPNGDWVNFSNGGSGYANVIDLSSLSPSVSNRGTLVITIPYFERVDGLAIYSDSARSVLVAEYKDISELSNAWVVLVNAPVGANIYFRALKGNTTKAPRMDYISGVILEASNTAFLLTNVIASGVLYSN